MSEQKIVVVQVRSGNRSNKRCLATLAALGLGRVGKKREHKLTPDTQGMLNAVSHLVDIHKA